jgi:23S rRNA (cytidine2498-2'-O)-methyltransferase
MAEEVWRMVQQEATAWKGRPTDHANVGGGFERVHVWERDGAEPGEHGFEPGVSPLAEEVGQLVAAAGGEVAPPVNRLARSGQRVLDVMLVEPNQWWVGWHRAAAPTSRWPGGVFPVAVPEDAVSRAY